MEIRTWFRYFSHKAKAYEVDDYRWDAHITFRKGAEPNRRWEKTRDHKVDRARRFIREQKEINMGNAIRSKAEDRWLAHRHGSRKHDHGDRGNGHCSCDMCRSQYMQQGNRKHQSAEQVIQQEAAEFGVRVRIRNPFHHRWYR